jgi:hypothetical protein
MARSIPRVKVSHPHNQACPLAKGGGHDLHTYTHNHSIRQDPLKSSLRRSRATAHLQLFVRKTDISKIDFASRGRVPFTDNSSLGRESQDYGQVRCSSELLRAPFVRFAASSYSCLPDAGHTAMFTSRWDEKVDPRSRMAISYR